MQRVVLWSAPILFVLFWSTGFIGARLGLPYAEPFWFLTLRFSCVIILLVPIAFVMKNHWPPLAICGHNAITGIFIHAAYLGGVFFAIDRGMSAGISALIVSLQPILTLLLAALFIGEKILLRTWGWFFVGLTGTALVLSPAFDGAQSTMQNSALVAIVIALLGIVLGTIYQKRYGGDGDLLPKLIMQYLGAVVVLGVLSTFSETQKVVWQLDFIIALSWLVLVLSVFATGLLMYLINRDSVARTSALFFLVPGFTALVAHWLFDEVLSPVQLLGLAISTIAVALVNKVSMIRKKAG